MELCGNLTDKNENVVIGNRAVESYNFGASNVFIGQYAAKDWEA